MISREHLVQVESQTYRLRLLTLLAVLALVYWTSVPGMNVWLVVTAGAGYLVYSLALHYLLIPVFYRAYLVAVMMVADFLFAAAVVYLVGIASVGFLVLPLTVIYHAIYLGYTGSLVSATVTSFISLLLAFQKWDPGVLSVVAFRIPLLYLVAMFTGYMAQQRFRERDARMALQEALRAEEKARALVGVARQLRVDPDRVLQDIAAAAAGVTGALQCLVLVLVRDQAGGYFEGRAAFPASVEQGVNDVASLREPFEGHWVGRPGMADGAVVLRGPDLPQWARGSQRGELVAVPLSSGEGPAGIMYCLPESGQPVDDLARLGTSIMPLAATALADAERYARAERHASELLQGLQGAVDKMGRVREAQARRSLTRGGLSLNPTRSQATLDGAPLSLSPTEFDVLYYLAERAGQPVNQATLLKEVWGNGGSRSNVVDVCVHRLRRKLGKYPGGKDLVVTARGAGYMFRWA